ncbi:isoprenylcysteine carboxylmethyltransferase family protein [Patescibacteria group bacterium]|nr:isoprenylcysteine carboxylmethyltransferase family protein [Patescibacteria group bacterium]
MNSKAKSIIFVLLQFVFGIYLLATTNIHKLSLLSSGLIFAGLVLGLWAIYTMKKSVLRITPDVDKKARLVEDGPYRLIRHPMYSSLLTAGLGLLLMNVSLIRLLVYIFLIVDLMMKLSFEEKLLEKHFKDYAAYKKNTKRIIPFFY